MKIRHLTNAWNLLINSLIFLRYKKPLILNSYVFIMKGKLVKNNWGDDINKFLWEYITGRHIIFANCSLFHKISRSKNYLFIGSIIDWLATKESIVWGAGVISEDSSMKIVPKEILAVRGPRTRNFLLSKGIDCPEIYGDPALLLSRFYKPETNKKRYKIGIIPHIIDRDNVCLQTFLRENHDVLFINLGNYGAWTDVIDAICSCDVILSSSLHGLIVSDSYGVPNVWITLSDKLAGGTFKFIDYFESVGRDDKVPFVIKTSYDFLKAKKKSDDYRLPKIDLEPLLSVCPILSDINANRTKN